jgi:hypothetical protein
MPFNFLAFLENNISICIPKFTKFKKDLNLNLSEMHLLLKNGSIELINKNESQDNGRINSFLNLIKLCDVDKLNCEFILNMYEAVYEETEIPRFCFAAAPNSNNILIPDSHNFKTNYIIQNLDSYDIPFKDKLKSAVFAGSDTGKRRSQGWTMRSLVSFNYINSEFIKSSITYADSDMPKRFSKDFDYANILSEPLSIDQQLKYQIVLNINGNSTSWERLLWAMASNSICVFVKPFNDEEMYSWYYPLMEMCGICPYVEYSKLEDFIKNNDFENEFWIEKKKQQKIFAKYVSSIDTQVNFLNTLLNKYNEFQNS